VPGVLRWVGAWCRLLAYYPQRIYCCFASSSSLLRIGPSCVSTIADPGRSLAGTDGF